MFSARNLAIVCVAIMGITFPWFGIGYRSRRVSKVVERDSGNAEGLRHSVRKRSQGTPAKEFLNQTPRSEAFNATISNASMEVIHRHREPKLFNQKEDHLSNESLVQLGGVAEQLDSSFTTGKNSDAEQPAASNTQEQEGSLSTSVLKSEAHAASMKPEGDKGIGGTGAAAAVACVIVAAFGALVYFVRPTMGDVNASLPLLFDNIGVMLAASSAMFFVMSSPFAGKQMPTNIHHMIYCRVVPGMVPTMLFGAGYYSWMAVRISRQHPGHTMCALPYGINTPAVFCFIFGIMMPTVTALAQQPGMDPNKAVEKAFDVGVAANLLAGVFSILFAALGPTIMKLVPSAALMIGLAGIGFTWLGIHQVMISFSYASVGMVSMVLGIVLLLGGVRAGKIPPALVLIVLSTTLGWCSGHGWQGGGSVEALKEAAKDMGTAYLPGIIGSGAFKAIPDVLSENIGIVLPIAFAGSVGTILNVQSAKGAGDDYPLREAMLLDGLTTVTCALFGSPLGTCIYIGHPTYKEMGGFIGYQLLSALFFSSCAMLGAFGLINALVPPYAISPINLFIGLMITSDAFSCPPDRHIPGCVLGLVPALADFIVKSMWAPQMPGEDWWGLVSLSHGSLLLSILWTAIFVFFIDYKFKFAAAWSIGAAACSAIGLLHQGSLDFSFKKFTVPSYPYSDDAKGTTPFQFTMGYALVAIFLGVLAALQFFKIGNIPQPLLTDEEEDDAHKELERVATRVSKRSLSRFKRSTVQEDVGDCQVSLDVSTKST